MLSQVRKLIEKDLDKQFMTGGPVNLMASILKANKAAGMDLKGINLGHYGVKEDVEPEKPKSEIDPNWFKKHEGSRMWDNPKWAAIAETFVKIEEATDPVDICVQIDHLNGQQHNSFHVLIDLQTGRMLEGKSFGSKYQKDTEARQTLQDILEMVKGDSEPMEYVDKMSEEVRKIMNKYKGHQELRATAAEAKKVRK